MITNSINAFLFIDGLKFSSLILLTTSVITSCLEVINLEAPKRFIPYEKGISEQLKRVANEYGLEVIFKRSLSLKSKLQTNSFKSDSTCGVV